MEFVNLEKKYHIQLNKIFFHFKGANMLSKLLKYLKENSWKTIYVTQDTYEYGRVKGSLNDARILSKTKSSTPMAGPDSSEFGTTYDILVKQKDYHKATQILNKS